MFPQHGSRSHKVRRRPSRSQLARRSQLSLESLEARQLLAYDTAIIADAPIAYYRFEEAVGATTANNQGTLGDPADGAYNNLTLGQASALPALGNAGRFNNSSVRIPDVSAFNLGTGDYTIEFWFNSSTSARGDIFTYKGGGGDLGVHYTSTGSNNVSLYHGGHDNTTPGVLTPNNWYHVAIVRSGTGTNELAIFVNGVPASYGTSADSWNIANDLLIGSNHDGNPANRAITFNGLIDEFAIYNKALTNNQIRAHVEAAFDTYSDLPILGLNPSLYYGFDDAPGSSTITDDSGDGRTGTVVNGSTLGVPSASLQLGSAIELNGSNQYITTAPAGQLGLNGSFTASAWVKADALDADRTIFGTAQTGTNLGLHLILRDGVPHMGFYANDLSSGVTVRVGEWYHLTWKYDATFTEQSIYVNGVQVARETGHAAFAGNDIVRIGSWENGRYFDGKIDEAAIFPSALPHAAILALYETGIEAHANDDATTTTETATVNLPPAQLLGNDEGISGGIAGATAGTAGTSATLNADGSVSFNPGTVFNSLGAGQNGTATFTYQFVAHEDYGNRRIVVGPFGPGGTYNAYMFDPLPQTWDEARVAAYSTKLNGVSGQLVGINSLAENNFLRDAFRNVDGGSGLEFWIGQSDSSARSLIDFIQLTGTEAGTAPINGWRYVNGEPITFSNWAGGEPNDSGGEDATQMRGDGLWNDHRAGISLSEATDHSIAAVYEFELGLTSLADFVAPGFTVRQVRTSTGVGSLAVAEQVLAGQVATLNERTMHYPVVNMSGNGDGRFGENLPMPFVGDGSNYAIEATGHLFVPQAGDYSFIVNSDDGFSLSITGATLGAVGGQDGTTNQGGALVFTAGRGAADSVGVFNFPAPGFYPIRLVHFEGAGGDSVELSAAQGSFTAYNSNFALVGDVNGLKVFNQLPTSLLQTATVTVDVVGENDVPVAGTVAARTISEGQSVTFTAVGAADADAGETATLSFQWDINGDGTFDVTTNTPSVTRTWAELEGLGIDGPFSTSNVRVQATDAQGATSAIVTTSLTVNNVAPTLDFDGPLSGAPGIPLTYTFSAADPSTGDTAAGFTFDIDWGDQESDSFTGTLGDTVSHTFATAGTYTVVATVTDRDGDTSEVTLEVNVSQVFVDDEGNLIINGGGSTDRIILSNGRGGIQATINNRRMPAMMPLGGVVRVLGHAGNDTITVMSSVAWPVEIFGGDGNDYITGGSQADTLDGGDGNDRVLGGSGADILMGGNGNDTLSGGLGADILWGDLFLDADGIETEGLGNDTLKGDGGNDTLEGGDGNDRINGGTGNDILFGRAGNDRLGGDAGHDLVLGDEGADQLYGNDGNDVVIGGEHADNVYGGRGSDLVLGDGLDALDADLLYLDWLAGGIGDVDFLRGQYASLVVADDAPENLYGETGNDWILAFVIDRVRDGRSSDVVDRDPV